MLKDWTFFNGKEYIEIGLHGLLRYKAKIKKLRMWPCPKPHCKSCSIGPNQCLISQWKNSISKCNEEALLIKQRQCAGIGNHHTHWVMSLDSLGPALCPSSFWFCQSKGVSAADPENNHLRVLVTLLNWYVLINIPFFSLSLGGLNE